jgi:flagellar biosynthesis/type III secretory pathway M-ring protein FliF/YscJ
LELVVAILILALIVAFIVLGPLRRGAEIDRRDDDRRAALEAAKEAKYREIKDAELDHEMGKLSDEDHRAIDEELRAQAIEILRQIDRLQGDKPSASR